MARYSKGSKAWAIDDRSGFRINYTDLRTEWNGLRVHKNDVEPKHPQLEARRLKAEPQALFKPRPNTDDDGSDEIVMTLEEYLNQRESTYTLATTGEIVVIPPITVSQGAGQETVEETEVATSTEAPTETVDTDTGLSEMQTKTGSVTVGSVTRNFIYTLPTGLKASRPVPIVLHFHGGTGTAQAVYDSHLIHASIGYAIVVYPNGSERKNLLSQQTSYNGGGWNDGSNDGWAATHSVDDLGFMDAVLAYIQARYTVDTTKIFAGGHSKGAMFAYHLAYNRPSTYRAIAVVEGTLNNGAVAVSVPAPPPALVIHSLNDPNVYWNDISVCTAAACDERPAAETGYNYWLAWAPTTQLDLNDPGFGHSWQSAYTTQLCTWYGSFF